MQRKIFISTLSISLLVGALSFVPSAQAAGGSCASITKALIVADGYKAATGPIFLLTGSFEFRK